MEPKVQSLCTVTENIIILKQLSETFNVKKHVAKSRGALTIKICENFEGPNFTAPSVFLHI